MKLRVNWAPDKLLTFEEVLKRKGYYFNALSGAIYRHDGHPAATEENVGAIERATEAGTAPVDFDPRHWLLITDDLDLTEGDVRGMLHDVFNVRQEDVGRLVSTVADRGPRQERRKEL